MTRVAVVPLLVLVAACSNSPSDTMIRVSGHVDATEIRLAPDVGGRVLEMGPREGARISVGDEILRLDPRDTELALRRVRAELAQAEAQLALVRAGARAEEIRQAEAEIDAVRAELAAGRAELASADQDLTRFETLLATNAGSVKQRDDAATRRDVARDRLAAGEARLQAAQAALDRLLAGARAQEILAARARVEAARAGVAMLEKSLADTTLVSPVDGIVTEQLAHVGEIVAPRAPVIVLVDLDRAWADVFVAGPTVPRIRLGQTATLFTDAGGPGIAGTVTYVSPIAEFTPRNVQTADERARLVYRIRISVDNRDGVLKQGMAVEAEIPLLAMPAHTS